jgi:hypothetical protein
MDETTSTNTVYSEAMEALKAHAKKAEEHYESLHKQIKKLGDKDMTESINVLPSQDNTAMLMAALGNRGNGGDGGMFGGGGMIGGLILGSLLRNNGNLFGGNGGDGVVGGAVLRNPPEQNQANMDLMQSIGAVDKAVAVGTAAMESSQAQQSAAIVSQLNAVTGSLATRIEGVKDAVNAGTMVLSQQVNGVQQQVMQNRYELSKDISSDGEKTRALITQQYELNLQRQLADANAAIIELRGDNRLAERSRGIEVTTTNNINQMQQQQQQQAQYGQLANLIWSLGQSIRNDNSAINVGSGTQTSTPTNTNTNIR